MNAKTYRLQGILQPEALEVFAEERKNIESKMMIKLNDGIIMNRILIEYRNMKRKIKESI